MRVDDDIRLSTVLDLARGRWRFLAALGVLGALLGAAGWLLLAPGHVASTLVLLQGSRDKQEVLSETRVATSLVVLDRVAATVGPGVAGTDLQDRVTAAVVDGNVLGIEAVAADAEQARVLADLVTTEYIRFSAQLVDEAASATAEVLMGRRDELQARIDTVRDRITDLQGSPVLDTPTAEGIRQRAEIDRLGGELTSAVTELQDVTGRIQDADAEAVAGGAGIAVIQAAVPQGAAQPTLVVSVVGGAALVALLGLVAMVVAVRNDLRLRDPDVIAAACGAPFLGRVPVPASAAAAGPRGRSRAAALRGILTRLVEPAPAGPTLAEEAFGTALRRALDRTTRGTAHAARLLVVHARGDEVARHAVVALAAAAAAAGAPVAIRTDDAALAALLPEPAGACPGVRRPVDVVELDTAHPRLELPRPRPDHPAGAVLLVTAGTRNGWELAGMTGACNDGAVPVLGVLVAVPVAHPAAAEDPPPRSEPPEPASPAGTADTVMAGPA